MQNRAFWGLFSNTGWHKQARLVLYNTGENTINQNDIKVKGGTEYIIPEGEIKLVGMKMNDSQDWKSQVSGTGGVISSLNQYSYLTDIFKKYLFR